MWTAISRKRAAECLEEELFAFVAAGLRKLKPLRKHLPVLLETVLNPLAAAPGEEGQSLRLSHLETVARLSRKRGAQSCRLSHYSFIGRSTPAC